MRYLYDMKCGTLQVREIEISLRKWSGGSVPFLILEGTSGVAVVVTSTGRIERFVARPVPAARKRLNRCEFKRPVCSRVRRRPTCCPKPTWSSANPRFSSSFGEIRTTGDGAT